MKGVLFISTIVGISFILNGQNETYVFNFNNITTENGLTDNRFNNYIFQDSDGFIWISSLDGVNRYDGFTVKSYDKEDGLRGKNIQSNFFEDSCQNVWFSTFEGLHYYSKNLDSIIQVPIFDEKQKQIEQGFKVFHLDKTTHRLWLTGDNRIIALNTLNHEEYSFLPNKFKGYHFNVTSNNKENINKILISPWRYGNGIHLIQLQDTNLISQQHLFSELKFLPRSLKLSDSAWLLINKDELLLFNEGCSTQFKELPNQYQLEFYDALKITENTLLISTNNDGIILYDLTNNDIIAKWSGQLKTPHTLPYSDPRELYILDDNFLWTSGGKSGVSYTYLYNNIFSDLHLKEEEHLLEVSSIIEDDQGNIWTSRGLDGIAVFSQKGEELKNYNKCHVLIDSFFIWQLHLGNEGNIFAVTDKGLFYQKEHLDNFILVDNSEQYSIRYLLNIYPNRILLSTNQGIRELIKDEKGELLIVECKELSNSKGFHFRQIFQASNNNVYLPYQESELWIYKSSQKGLKLLKKLKPDLELYSFFESKIKPDVIWVGSSEGLKKIVGDSIILNVSTTSNVLNTSSVYNIIEDDEDEIWLGTNKGLWSYNIKNGKIYQYEEEDGLPSNLFSFHQSSILASNGHIWMGTNKGLVKFDPKTIKPYSIPPKVYIDRLLINDDEERKGIGEATQLTLPYQKSTLHFEVPAIGYYKAKRSKVNYQLKGYDDNWLSVKNGQPIRFTKLPHGDYTFRVQAEDVNGNKSDIRELAIQITPPFWRTWWFYLLCSATILALMYAVYKYRVAQIRKEEEKKTAIARLELQVLENELKALRAQMNPHFLFNTMNSIKGIIIKQETKKAIEYLTKLSSLIRAILSNSERKTISLAKELEALKLYMDLESLRFTNNFNYQIQVDKNVDQSFVHIPPLVLQPFVENAIWHGLLPKDNGNNQLTIRIFRKDDLVLCEIEDNGVGRKATQQPKRKTKHQSMGIGITEKRVQLLHSENRIDIIDLVNENQQPMGTKVILALFAPD